MSDYKYLGNFSAVEPWSSVAMRCDDCRVEWMGCWDNFECPQCRKGELPALSNENYDQAMAREHGPDLIRER